MIIEFRRISLRRI